LWLRFGLEGKLAAMRLAAAAAWAGALASVRAFFEHALAGWRGARETSSSASSSSSSSASAAAAKLALAR
jgi:hypothetical protein